MRQLLDKLKGQPTAFLAVLLAAWWVVNLVQAGVTELANDEAYYWMFAQFPDWGYFDHPPMVAYLVYLGSFIDSELGVRLLAATLQPLYLMLIWFTIRRAGVSWRDAALYFMIACSMPMLQLYGFLALPDAPLMFFAALFLWAYKRFVDTDKWLWALVLGVALAGLGYSKYHGALLLVCVVVSNLKLLRSPKFYAGCLVALVLMMPHLLWQYNHDWVSVRYHLVDRNGGFAWGQITEYILNLVATMNPFIVPIFVYALLKRRIVGAMERTYLFVTLGFIGVFFLSSLRGHVQPQWNLIAVYGVVVLTWLYALDRPRVRRYLMRLGWVMIALLAVARVEMAVDFIGLKKFELFNNRQAYSQLAEVAGGAPVVFDSQYAIGSKYNYYSDGESFANPSAYHRTSQYQFWDYDTQYAGRRVMCEIMWAYPDREAEKNVTLANGRTIYYDFVDNYVPVRKVVMEYDDLPTTMSSGDILGFDMVLHNPYDHAISLVDNVVTALWKQGRATVAQADVEVSGLEVLPPKSTSRCRVKVKVPDVAAGDYSVGLFIHQPKVASWFNGPRVKVVVE